MDSWPSSIREINSLPSDEKLEIYHHLVPDWLLDRYGIPHRLSSFSDKADTPVTFRCPLGSRALEVVVKHQITDRDPLMYLNMADTFNRQLLVLLVVVNDPEAPRFNTDVDTHGNNTHFGTTSRNIPAELQAMESGLAPGQVRKGLRAFKQTVPVFEDFVGKMGHDIFFIEPLAYHNAIIFERYGFNYLQGLQEMKSIHQEFQPGGLYHNKLTNNNPFRKEDAWSSVRGRSWAIHDGILGHSFTGFQMYKRINQHAGVNTFPESQW